MLSSSCVLSSYDKSVVVILYKDQFFIFVIPAKKLNKVAKDAGYRLHFWGLRLKFWLPLNVGIT